MRGVFDYLQFAIALALMFSLGWLGSSIYTTAAPAVQTATNPLTLFSLPADQASPRDRIAEEDIHVFADRVVIDIEDPVWATFTDTNSMDPVIDTGANAIEIIPKTPEEIQAGDIIAYTSGNISIIHRVVEVGNDGQWYAITKGDNNPTTDPGKVRFSQIKRVVVAIIY